MSQTKAQLLDTLVASLLPASDSSVDIGSNAVRFANIYGDTLYGNGANLTGINTDLVSDTSPQLGGNLDVNSKNIVFGDSGSASDDRLTIGDGTDLSIYHNSGFNIFANANSSQTVFRSNNLFINNEANDENLAKFLANGAVELYYDNTKRFETTSSGVTISGITTTTNSFRGNDNVKLDLGTGSDLQIYHDGSHSRIYNSTGNLSVRSPVFDVLNADGSERMMRATADGGCDLFFNGVSKLETRVGDTIFHDDIRIQDNNKINIGTGDDLQIYHDGNSRIQNTNNSCDFRIQSDAIELKGNSSDEMMLKGVVNGAVELYHDNSKKFETTSIGATVTGNLTLSAELNLTGGSDAARFIDAAIGTNGLTIRKTTGGDSGHEYMAQFIGDGGVELYHDGTKKFETYSNGATVTGNLNASNVDLGDNAMARFGASNDLRILHDATNSFIQNDTGNLVLAANRGGDVGGQIWIDALNGERSARFYANAQAELFYNGTKTFATIDGGVEVTGQFYVTAEINLQNGTTDAARFIDAGLGSNTLSIRGTSGGDTNHETLATFTRNGSVGLYYDNVQRFSTNSSGAKVHGNNGNIFEATCSTNSTANIVFQNTEANTLGDMRILVKTAANQGSDPYIKFDAGGNDMIVGTSYAGGASNKLVLGHGNSPSGGVIGLHIDGNGQITPDSNNARDLGSSSLRFRNIYTNDLNLSNEGSPNDVDGTWGSYTIQEGAEDLFLINKRNGKKYKFNLTEVS